MKSVFSIFQKLVLSGSIFLALAVSAWAQTTPPPALTPKGSLSTNTTTGGVSLGPNGYPEWVADINGVKVDLPTPVYGNGVTPPTMIFDTPVPGNDPKNTGFNTEAFYFLASAVSGRASLTLGVEAAYGAGDRNVAPNATPDEFLFVRVRIRFVPTLTGTYTVLHPWGTDSIEVTAADLNTRLDVTRDWGGFAPIPNATPPVASSFERILFAPDSVHWRFLTATTLTPQTLSTSWLGDGVTLTTVTGGFNNQNFFRIIAPNGITVVDTNQFTVSGHIAGTALPTAPAGRTTDLVTVTLARLRPRTQIVQIRATSTNGLAMTADILAADRTTVLVRGASLGTIGRADVTVTGRTAPAFVRVSSITAGTVDGFTAPLFPVN